MKKHIFLFAMCLFLTTSFAQQSTWESSANELFSQAKELYNKQLYNPAKSKFEQVIAIKSIPVHTQIKEESTYYQAMCALYLMNKDAEVLLENFIITYPASPFEQKAAFAAADYFFNRRKYRDAKEWFAKVDKRNLSEEEKTEYYFKLGYAQLQTREREEAKLSFREVKENEAQYASSAKYYFAHIAYEDSNFTTALENFEPLLDDPSFGPVVPYYLAQIYYQKEDYKPLIEYGEPLLERATEKRKPEIAKLLGEAYLSEEKFEKAIPFLEQYKSGGGRMRRSDYYSLGYAYYKTENLEKAIENFNKISERDSDLAQSAFYHLGDCYLKTGDKQKAFSAFKAASEIGSDKRIHQDALFNYAKLNYELANPYGSAVKAFQEYLEKYPNALNKAEANEYLANLYLTTKDYDNALKALSNTGLRNPNMQEAYQKVSYFRGVQLYNAAQIEGARKLFGQSLKYPKNATYVALAHYWLAESYYREEKYNAALQEIAAFENVPGSYTLSEFANARYNKAYCYFMLEEYAKASTTFRLFVDNKKANPHKVNDAQLRLGDAYFMQGKYQTAITYYNNYLGTSPQDADYAIFQKSLCQGLAGDDAKKVQTLNNLVMNYPQSRFAVDGLFEQGATYLVMDKNQEALSTFETFVEKYPESKHTRRAWLNIAVIYRNLDNSKKALKTFEKVVEDYPATAEANEAIAFSRMIYAEENRLDEYVEWVEGISFANIQRGSLDSTMYNTAFDFYSMGDCDKARSAFQKYIGKFPDGIFAVPANFYLGECAYVAKDDEVAEKALNRVVNEPRNEFTERSISMLASIYYAANDFENALKYYEQLLNFSEEITELRKARLGAMRCAVAIDVPKKALQYAEIVLADERTDPQDASEAMLVRARSYWKLNELSNAHQAYDEVLNNTKGESQAEASYHIAQIQNYNAEYEASNKTIFWMIDNLPSYQKWRFNSLLVLADNYYKLDDAFQANYTLDFIIDENYSPEVVEAAKSMKEAIRRAEEQEEMLQKQAAEEEETVELQESESSEKVKKEEETSAGNAEENNEAQ